MALTKIGSIGINTGIQFAGVTTIATLNASDNVLSVGGTVNFASDVSIGGTLTYEDVTNIDAIGLITARNGIVVGSGITLSKDGDIFATGISTFSEGFAGDVLIDDKIVHRGDTDTAIRFPTANVVSVETGGIERARINASGKLLVNVDTARGVGGSQFRQLQIEGTGGDSGISIVRNSANASPPSLSFGKSRASSVGGTTIVQADDALGSIGFAGADGTNLQTNAVVIRAEVDGTPGENDMPGRLIFKTTADGSASPTERLRITSTGDVGIGIDNPNYKLHVYGGNVRVGQPAGTDCTFDVQEGTTTNPLRIKQTATEASIQTFASQPLNIRAQAGTGSTSVLAFWTRDDERVRLDANGRVLVGISTTPNAVASVAIVGSYGASSNNTPFVYICRDQIVDNVSANASLGQIFFASKDGYRGSTIETQAEAAWSGSSSPGNLIFKTTPSGSTTPSEAARINSSGSLLINHTTARYDDLLQIEGTGGESTIAIVRNSNNTSGAGLMLGKSRTNSVGGNTIVQDGDKLGVISFTGADGTDLASLGAQISGEVDGTPGSDDMPGRLVFKTTSDGNASSTERLRIDSSGHTLPGANNTYNLGSASTRWANVYTNDLHLSNQGSTNSVDNTWGDFTIQEGETDLYLINNRSGKKYKFNLTEVS